MQGYCLVCVGKRISCSNANEGKQRQVIISTQASKTTRENIVTVFGAKFLKTLLDVDFDINITAKPKTTESADTQDEGDTEPSTQSQELEDESEVWLARK